MMTWTLTLSPTLKGSRSVRISLAAVKSIRLMFVSFLYNYIHQFFVFGRKLFAFQHVRPAAQRFFQGFSPAPGRDPGMVAGKEHLRHWHAPEVPRPGVWRIIQKTD